jgi:hypothetical protein
MPGFLFLGASGGTPVAARARHKLDAIMVFSASAHLPDL